MGRNYESELAELTGTFEWACAREITAWIRAKERASSVSAIIVASGGSLAAAHFLQGIYQQATGRLASVMTPLEYLGSERIDGTDVWLLSAGGANADILAAWQGVIERRAGHIFVMCAQPDSPLVAAASVYANATVYAFEVPAGRDGFLATNSLVAFLVLLARLFAPNGTATASPPYTTLGSETHTLLRDRSLLVLYDPALKPVALDIESRFSEAALGHVLVTDLRNFAHGRHVWLAKRGASSSVLMLSGPETVDIADGTVELLPNDIPIQRWRFDMADPWAVIGGVVGSMRLAFVAANLVGIDPGRPGVPEFGSRIYSLGPNPAGRPTGRTPQRLALESKAGRSLVRLVADGEHERYEAALASFEGALRAGEFTALVVDFDGTLVNTKERFDPISQPVLDELVRLLKEGLQLGIATGRGKSVHKALHARIPNALHAAVTIGYYNGGVIRPLSALPSDLSEGPVRDELRRSEEALSADPEIMLWKRELRPGQITVEAGQVALRERELWFRVTEVLARQRIGEVKVMHSSHSVDILPPDVTKVAVVQALTARTGGACLQIGDRGRWPGNDAELLALPYSLSVDEVSPDLSTCWNLLPAGLAGAQGAAWYLRSIRHGRVDLRVK